MDVNSIDEFIDKSLDNFYNDYVLKDSYFKDITKNPNFIKYYLKITNSITDFINKIKTDKIKKIVNSEANVNIIIDIIKRYLAYYIFLTIGYSYNWEQQSYLNNINEYTINHNSSDFKINNFFNSENNAIIVKFFKLIKNVQYIFSIKDIKKSVLVTSKGKEMYKDAITFLNNLGEDFINAVLKTGSEEQRCHNLIKIIVFKILYQEQEKIEIFKIIEDVEHEKSNYKFIEIVESRKNTVDYFAIKQLLASDEDYRTNYIYENILAQNKEVKELTAEDKIIQLLKYKILIPITEDFMRYHKDTEKYDVDTKKTFGDIMIKKKENTKLKYIINKMDTASSLYSIEPSNKLLAPKTEKKIDKEKVFFTGLAERRAVLFNDLEEIKIVNKMQNQSRNVAGENIDFYEDLLNYRQYVYVNFRNFNRLGFELSIDDTVDAVRSVSFDFPSKDKNTTIQTRVMGDNLPAHIVGFLITNIDNNPLECLRLSKIINIRDITDKLKKTKKLNDTDEGIETLSYILKHTIFNLNTQYPPIYWLFDKRDLKTLNNYELIETTNDNNLMKQAVSIIYDNCNKYLYKFIKKRIQNMKFYSTVGATNILDNIQNIIIPIEKKYIADLEKTVLFSNKIKKQPEHDIKEDTYPGFEFDLIKRVPVKHIDDSDKIKHLRVSFIKKSTQSENIIDLDNRESYENIYNPTDEQLVQDNLNISEISVCQHTLTWQELMTYKKKNALMFEKKMFEFMQQYVIQNSETEFICKSCGTVLYINNYVADGYYDDSDGKFKTLSVVIDVPLEDIFEYKKIDKTIRTIDRIIEKVASISNIQYYIGNVNIVKWHRKNVEKNVIDILLNHNRNLRKIYDERKQGIDKKYGLNKNLSNLFYFDVDNNIFVTSSASTDFYKLIKANNVVAYIIIMLIFDINEGLISNLTKDKNGKIDKICNINNYFKHKNLFDNMKIISNRSNDTNYITNYPILTFLIYYFSCVLTKHKLWYMGTNIPKESMQPIIITTIIDALNSIIEISMNNKQIIYSTTSDKYFMKLNDIFVKTSIIDEIKLYTQQQESQKKVVDKRVPTKKPEVPITELSGKYEGINYENKNLTNHIIPFPHFNIFNKKRVNIDHISQITNCPNGAYHSWVTEGKIIKCKNCNVTGDVFFEKENVKNNKELVDKSVEILLTKLSKKKCIDNKTHLFVDGVCRLCGKNENEEYSKKDLMELEKNIDKDVKINVDKQLEVQKLVYKAYDNMIKIQTSVVNKIKKLYESMNDDVASFFVDAIEKIRKNISKNLMYNTYIVDHDHYGNLLKTHITFDDSDTKIMFKENHPFFKTNVIYYTNKQLGVDLFYDASSNIYLGYKESNKDFIFVKNSFKYLKINYSVKSKIIYLGFRNFFVENDRGNPRKVIENQLMSRLDNLKKSLIYIQRILYNLKHKEQKKDALQLEKIAFMSKFVDLVEDPIKKFTDKHRKDMYNINTDILTDWKEYYESVFYQNKYDEINIDKGTNFIDAKELSKEDIGGNLILCYIITELLKLVSINGSEKIVIEFVFDLIGMLFEMFNVDKYNSEYEVKRFMYILQARTHIIDTEKKGLGLEGFYGEDMTNEEMEVNRKAAEDNEEMENALDIDRDVDERGENEELLRDFDDLGDREFD